MSNKLKRIISSVLTVVMLFGLVCNSAVFPAYAADACGYDPAKTMSELDLSGEEALAGKAIASRLPMSYAPLQSMSMQASSRKASPSI